MAPKLVTLRKQELIGELSKYPPLFDKVHDDYKDKVLVENIWKIISNNMGVEIQALAAH